MINLLARFFIPDRRNYHQPRVRQAYGRLCGFLGIFFNLLLFGFKYFAGVISGSVAITADAFNNLSDAGSSVISLISFVMAGKKPDIDHPFGHGRIEYLSGLALSFLILLMGVELGKSSIDKILHPQPLEVGILPAVILVASIAVKLYMGFYNRGVGKKIDSLSLKATAVDSFSDSIATTVVLISMVISHASGYNIDGWAGLAVAVFILFAGYNALKDTLSPLLGQAPDPDTIHRIEEIVLSYPDVVGIHDIVVHDYGPGRLMVSLHAEVRGDGDIFALHDAVDSAENQVLKELGCLAVTIHMDPIEADNTAVA
ncbi:MAG: cation transporter, partial [Oscillospiraceae bacterium]|nr:cation transporter [Oscillospiraceae bacterium]